MTYVYVYSANNMESVRNVVQAKKNMNVLYVENLMKLKIIILMRRMNSLLSLKIKMKYRDYFDKFFQIREGWKGRTDVNKDNLLDI